MLRSATTVSKSKLLLCAGVIAGLVIAVGGCGSSTSSMSSGAAATSSPGAATSSSGTVTSAAASGGSSAATGGGQGELLVYSNSGKAYIQPVLDAFAKAYPNIKLAYTDVEDPVAFSRYRAESAQGARTADVIIASSPSLWDQNRNIALNWTPTDASAYPSFLTQFPGVFILSPDPAVSIYSKAKLPANRVPNTFTQLVSDLKQYPDLFNKKIVTYTADNFFGYSAFWGLVNKQGWGPLNALGPASKPQSDGVAMGQALATGAANYGFFESGLIRGSLTPTQQQLIGWNYMRDFTPLIPRGVAVTKAARNPTAAKTFLNWLYSVPGQQVLCGAGFTAFRTGVSCPDSLASVQQAVGPSNTFLIPFHSTIAQDQPAFVKRWHQVFG
jgi:iron(III) transport system substrate-binding protein